MISIGDDGWGCLKDRVYGRRLGVDYIALAVAWVDVCLIGVLFMPESWQDC